MEKTVRRPRGKSLSTGKTIRITDHKIAILLALQEHGILPTRYLALATGTTRKAMQGTLTDMFHESTRSGSKLLYYPRGQKKTDVKWNNDNLYSLSEEGRDVLLNMGLLYDAIRPSGEVFHQALTSAITFSIKPTAEKRGIKFIPGHVFLEKTEAERQETYRGPVWVNDRTRLIPDQFFGLEYTDRSI